MIYFTSDLHFCHDKPFLYEPRGFTNVEDMNRAIVKNWNSIVKFEDHVYILGDLMLKDNDKGLDLLLSLNGHLHIILGNHDTSTREDLYRYIPSVEEVVWAKQIKWNGYTFFLSHYPTLTANGPAKPDLKYNVINLYGHTHQKTNFWNECPYNYHVGLDSHNCTPVSAEQVIADIQEQINKLNNN